MMRDHKNRRIQLVGIGWVDAIPAREVKSGMKLSRDFKPTCDILAVKHHGTQIVLELRSPSGESEQVEYRSATLVAAYWLRAGQPIL
jgi:hypothetical protein